MKIVVVVGTGSGCGKTTVACRILRAFPGMGAVKISPRDGPGHVEWGPGEPGKDTDLYCCSGAMLVARIIGPRESVKPAWQLIRERFEGCRGVVIEGASALDLPEDKFVVFVVGEPGRAQWDVRNRELAALSSAIIERSPHLGSEVPVDAIGIFLGSSDRSDSRDAS